MTDKKPPPKGGSKGGTRFPRVSLEKALEYSKKLVSKTHTGPQPASIILPGVFGTAGPDGQVRASALKQYGLLTGKKEAYSASELAQNLNGATPEDARNHAKEVFLNPLVFKKLFDTYCDDNTSKAKIRQQASNLKVHPDSLDECVKIFIESAVCAGLATEKGDSVEIHAAPKLIENSDEEEGESGEDSSHEDTNDDANVLDLDKVDIDQDRGNGRTSQKSNIDIRIDPSMDPEKLDELLAVLQKYGQI